LGFRVQVSGLRVKGSGCRRHSVGFKVWGVGFRAYQALRVQDCETAPSVSPPPHTEGSGGRVQ